MSEINEKGYKDYCMMFSPENSRKASSYVMALQILDSVFQQAGHQAFPFRSLYDIDDIGQLERIRLFVKAEEKKARDDQPSIFDYGNQGQTSYWKKGFCSAAILSLIGYAEYRHEVVAADVILKQEKNSHRLSERLLAHFDLTKEGQDEISQQKRRKGQTYFHRMIFQIYNNRCALTGIEQPQLLIASHIIPWNDQTHKREHLNPQNGICLNALHDKAFDKGLMTFDDDYRAVLSKELRDYCTKDYYQQYFAPVDGKALVIPNIDYAPDKNFLEWHREHIFI